MEEILCPICKHITKIFLLGADSPHKAEARCIYCDKWIKYVSLKTPEEQRRKRKNNSLHRDKWKQLQGLFICSFCGITENDHKLFELDHIQPLANGGSDTFDNTRILCNSCHTIRTSLYKRISNLTGEQKQRI